ncbi:GDP-mannose 4,6-dehydratase [bacterium]|nr:GDP-mannose 4,6-dehydratase [bacterium]
MMKAIVFGVTGQDGSHLVDLLLSKDYETVVGVARRSSTDNTSRIKNALSDSRFKLVEGDITDVSSVMTILNSYGYVDEVYNLAAQSHVGTSFKQPALTWDTTGKGCLNILQSIVDLGKYEIRFYQASSSEMFGDSYDIDNNGNKYQNENTKFLPQSPYAISKCAAHYAVRLFREAYNLHASAGILFNHEGPRRGDNFVTKKITNWIVDFMLWAKNHYVTLDTITTTEDHICSQFSDNQFPKLRLGNLNAYRDWGYAGDYVEAMWLMLQQQYADDYVICTGNTYTIREFLDLAFNKVKIDNWSDFVVVDKEFYRPAEVNYLRGDCSKAKTKLGWIPKHDLQDLVSLMIDSRFHEKLSDYARHY